MPEPSVGLALIARNEEATLPTLLASVEGAFDQVVLVDTGSTDQTRQVFTDWAGAEKERNPTFSHTVAEFAWVDDFAAARDFADRLLDTDWRVWADCDDELHGAHNLRALAQSAPPEVVAFVANYNYAQDANGNCVCTLKRERLVRSGHGEWQGRVHEAQLIQGPTQFIPPEVCEWRHRKRFQGADSNERNLKILRAWLEDEPRNPRVLGYLGTEEMARGELDVAEAYLRRYLDEKTGWDQERAQIHRKLAQVLMAKGIRDDDPGLHEQAIGAAFEALRLLPGWPDSHLTLSEAHYHLGEWEKAAHWAQEVLRIGLPDTLLIVNPLDYQHAPRVLLAGALGALGQVDDAIRVADEAFAVAPHDGLAQGYGQWQAARKRDQTAQSVIALAQVLVGHDEQLGALTVLNAAPHYCRDHDQVVAMRSMLRERVEPLFDPAGYRDHYENGGSKPEDAVSDPLAVGDMLPRCAFLLDQCRELAA